MIPELIKQKIEEAYPNLHELFYRECAYFGYSLSKEKITKLEGEVERLKGLIDILSRRLNG